MHFGRILDAQGMLLCTFRGGFRRQLDCRVRGNDAVPTRAGRPVGYRGVFGTHREHTIRACFMQLRMHFGRIPGVQSHPSVRISGRFPTASGFPRARE